MPESGIPELPGCDVMVSHYEAGPGMSEARIESFIGMI